MSVTLTKEFLLAEPRVAAWTELAAEKQKTILYITKYPSHLEGKKQFSKIDLPLT